MIVHGWRLFLHPLFDRQLGQLEQRVQALAAKNPQGYRQQPAAKLLATIRRLMLETIPRDPSAVEFRQGSGWRLPEV